MAKRTTLRSTLAKSEPKSAKAAKATEQPQITRGQTLRLNEDAHKALKHLAVDKGVPAHDLMIEAINDLFRKYGEKPIA